jgi:predicted small lipoprotein YifL
MRQAALVLVTLAACGDNGGSNVNAPVLWLALDGRETEVKLAEDEPEPF